MDAGPARMASPAAEDPPRNLPKQRSRAVNGISSRDNATVLLLLIIAIFSQFVPLSILPLSAMLCRRVPPISLILCFTTLINGPAVPPLAVLCITSCDGQFFLNLVLEILTL